MRTCALWNRKTKDDLLLFKYVSCKNCIVCRYLVHYGVSFDKYFGACSIKLINGTRMQRATRDVRTQYSHTRASVCVVRVHDLCLAEIMIHISGRVLVSCDIN